MADENRPIAPPDWISKTLATLDAISGYTYVALAAAAALIIFAPSPLGVDFGPIRKDWGGWIAACMVIFALLALAKIARAIHPMIVNEWIARADRRARAMEQADVLDHLSTLSLDERDILAYCLANNERSIVSNYLNAPLTMLVTKGIFQMAPNPIFTPMQVPYMIPNFVWRELQNRRAEFPLRRRNDGTSWMRR
jgi:hypothetical protein